MTKNKKDEETIQNHQDPQSGGRRRFINQALAASAGIAVSRFLPHLKTAPVYASSGCAPTPLPPNELVNPGEIASNSTGVLQSVLVVKGEERTVPTVTGKYSLSAYQRYRDRTLPTGTCTPRRSAHPPVLRPCWLKFFLIPRQHRSCASLCFPRSPAKTTPTLRPGSPRIRQQHRPFKKP